MHSHILNVIIVTFRTAAYEKGGWFLAAEICGGEKKWSLYFLVLSLNIDHMMFWVLVGGLKTKI